jgi:hypothetical protein
MSVFSAIIGSSRALFSELIQFLQNEAYPALIGHIAIIPQRISSW